MNEFEINYKSKDFRSYFCQTQKRNYWVLGYFGGGSLDYARVKAVAEAFAEETGYPIDDVKIDEILSSRRYKGFKFVYVTNSPSTPQLQLASAEPIADFHKHMRD